MTNGHIFSKVLQIKKLRHTDVQLKLDENVEDNMVSLSIVFAPG